MTGKATTTPTTAPSYLIYDRSDPANPKIVIACGWWAIPAGKADTIEPTGTPVADWLTSLSPDNYDWATDALDADLGTITMPDTTSWATPLDHLGALPTKLDTDPDDLH